MCNLSEIDIVMIPNLIQFQITQMNLVYVCVSICIFFCYHAYIPHQAVTVVGRTKDSCRILLAAGRYSLSHQESSLRHLPAASSG